MQKDREKTRMYNIIYILSIVLIGFISLLASLIDRPKAEIVYQETSVVEEAEETSKITVYISGEVKSPALYELEKDTRVTEAIDIAGGFTANADVDSVNLAKTLKDGDHIKVPAVRKSSGSTSGSKITTTVISKEEERLVDINCGDVEEYMKVSGMTREIAENMVEFINQYDAFLSIEELKFVEGITPALYKKLAPQFTI